MRHGGWTAWRADETAHVGQFQFHGFCIQSVRHGDKEAPRVHIGLGCGLVLAPVDGMSLAKGGRRCGMDEMAQYTCACSSEVHNEHRCRDARDADVMENVWG